MKGGQVDFRSRNAKYKSLTVVLICVILVLAVGIVGFSLTEDKSQKKAQKISSEKIQAENPDAESMEKNPLKLEQSPKLTEAVKNHFAQLSQNKDFIESYDDLQVYTKLGKYKDTYVAFVRYEMKMKDIYTKVPGMETLYLKKADKDGAYSVSQGVKDEKLGKYVEKLVSHEDVKQMMTEVEASYQNALQSDALLREMLQDLRNAYEESAGTE